MIRLEKASANPVRLMAATMRPEAASTQAMIAPDRMASIMVVAMRRGVIGWPPANQETTTAVSRL